MALSLLGTGDWELGTGDCGLKSGDWQYNAKSIFSNRLLLF